MIRGKCNLEVRDCMKSFRGGEEVSKGAENSECYF